MLPQAIAAKAAPTKVAAILPTDRDPDASVFQ